MRKLLILAFLLYDIVAIATRANGNDYDEMDPSKRHYMQQLEDRRNWRKKALAKPMDEHRDWERRKYEYEAQRYMEDGDYKPYNAIDRQRELDVPPGYRHRKYDDVVDKMSIPQGIESAEVAHVSSLIDRREDKDVEKKLPLDKSCQRPHEKFESCFAGCASVTCDNPRDRMQACYPFCEAGCVCVSPYVRDDRTHKCVLPEDCTKGLKGIPDLGDEVAA